MLETLSPTCTLELSRITLVRDAIVDICFLFIVLLAFQEPIGQFIYDELFLFERPRRATAKGF